MLVKRALVIMFNMIDQDITKVHKLAESRAFLPQNIEAVTVVPLVRAAEQTDQCTQLCHSGSFLGHHSVVKERCCSSQWYQWYVCIHRC